MAIINGDSSAVVVDAVLTKKGRELLAQGKDFFDIKKYAFSDDEVDYSLWDPNNPGGTNYYGIKIENLPLMEASTDGTKSMRSKLITLNKGQTRVSVLSGLPGSISIGNGEGFTITPGTDPDVDDITGYTVTLYDSTVASIYASGIIGNVGTVSSIGPSTSLTAIGKTFTFTSRPQVADKSTTILVEGNESGASYTITLNVSALVVNYDGSVS